MSTASAMKELGSVVALAALLAVACGNATTPPRDRTGGTSGSAAGGAAGKGGAGGAPSTGGGGAGGAAGGAASRGAGGSGGLSGDAPAGNGGAALARGGAAGTTSAGQGGRTTTAGGAGNPGGPAGSAGAGGAGGGASCPAGYVWGGAFCSPPPPKLISPPPGSAVGTNQPDLFFEFAKGFTSVKLDLCADRPCSHILKSIVAGGNVSGVAVIGSDTFLPNGMIFWRGATSGPGSTADVLTTPIWEFAVLAHDKGWHRPCSWPQFADIEGDGFADLIVLSNSGSAVTVDEYVGSASGLQKAPSGASAVLSGPSCPQPSLAGVGDIDGDGFGDVVVADCDSLDVLTGGPTGFALPFSYRTALAGSFPSLIVSGDINQDGYADVSGIAETGPNAAPQLWQFFGSPRGLIASPGGPIALPDGADDNASVQVLGDLNADGYADVAVADKTYGGGTGVVWIFKGGASGLLAAPSTIPAPAGTYNFGSFPPSVGGTMTSDVRGEGNLALLVGGTTDSAGTRGDVYVYAAPGLDGPPGDPLILFPGGMIGVSSITGADVDGDGFGDVVVAAGSQIAVFRGSLNGLPSSPTDVLPAPEVGGASGNQRVRGIAALGDVNGDGRADFAAEIEIPGAAPSEVPVVYQGATGPLPQLPALTLSASQAVTLW